MQNERVRVAIHGSPRSGTTWLGEIVNSSPRTIVKYQPLFSYALKSFLTPTSSLKDIEAFFRSVASTEDEFLDQSKQRKSGTLPRFEKRAPTHVVYKEVRYHHILENLMLRCPDVLLVGCIRNPLSAINSWLRAPREFRADLGWNAKEEWRLAPKKNLDLPEEFNGFERWKEAARILLGLESKHPERVHLVEYRQLVTDPPAETKRLFDFLSLQLEPQTRDFLDRSTSENNPDAYSVFRSGQTDERWKTQLDSTIVEEILADVRGTDLERFVAR